MDNSLNATPNTNKRRSLGLSRRIIGVNNSKAIPSSTPVATNSNLAVTSFQCKDETTATESKPIKRVSDSASSGIAGHTSTLTAKLPIETAATESKKPIKRVSDSTSSRIAGNKSTSTAKPPIQTTATESKKPIKRVSGSASSRIAGSKSTSTAKLPIETAATESKKPIKRVSDSGSSRIAGNTSSSTANHPIETTAIESNKPIKRVSDSAIFRIAGNTSPSPNIVSHKLSLCKQTNDTMTRKRVLSQNATSSKNPKRLKLESNSELLNECDDQSKSSSSKSDNCDTKLPKSDEVIEKTSPESSSETSIQKEIERITKKIATTEKYQLEISELQELIAKWRAAGLKTIEEIQEKIQPTQDVSDILAHFNIDPGLFNLNSMD